MKAMRITTHHGDITKLHEDAIVNAANEHLAPGAGVCGAIFCAAGFSELEAACLALGGCDVGDAKATPSFRLHSKWVIHAVGPIYRDGKSGEPELLASCYRRSLEIADGLGARSVAFPAISTGIYGYPAREAAEIAVRTIRSAATKVDRVVLVAFDVVTLNLYEGLVRDSGPSEPR
jgi:O-acetyl-ADP-ribose deacetylase (regulator of RNase III)